MKLTELFTNNKHVTESGSTQQPAVNNASINRQIHALKPGQTLQGEVISKNGGEVQIKVSEDFIVKARVDQNINIEVGKNMTFEVKNNGQTLNLLPLYTNTATDANVLRALDMAALPVNSDTIAMTEQMMLAGLSIDRNSLQQVFRESNLYPESNIEDIIDLHKLSLPVNNENLTQLASYKNLSHQLMTGLNTVTNALPDTIQSMMQSGDVDGAAKLFQDILNLISPGGTGSPAEASDNPVVVIRDGAVQQSGREGGAVNMQPQQAGGNASAIQADLQQLLDLLAARSNEEPVMPVSEGIQTTEGMAPAVEGMQNQEEAIPSQERMTSQIRTQNPEDANSMQQQVQLQNAEAGNPLGQLQNPDGTGRALNILQRLIQQGINNKDTALLQNLLGNKEVENFIKENLQKIWTVTPENVAEKGEVEQLYQRLDKQLKSLTHALETANQTGSEAYRAATNLTQNIDFLQQINQTYTYLQLPLRLQQGKNAHGDLYVYSNKKNLASAEGRVTALLHLDMEHLGPLDVYVAMQNEVVSTKFYVQDEILDFLEEHMDMLTERLEKRGYRCSCEMLTRETEIGNKDNFVQKLLEKDPQVPIVQYAFDVRT